MTTTTTKQSRITQLQHELRYLWRPHDRLLTYVQTRLVELAHLGGEPPPAAQATTVQAQADTLAACQWPPVVEGEPA